jgi:hypothetical protein
VGLVLDQLGGIHLEGLCQLAACLRPGLCAVALDAGERGYGDPYFLRQFLMARGRGRRQGECHDRRDNLRAIRKFPPLCPVLMP